MIHHLNRHIPQPCQPALLGDARRRCNRCRLLILLPLAGLVLALASCSGGGPNPEPPPMPVTDTEPVGEGLKVIGYALLGGAVVLVLGRLLTR